MSVSSATSRELAVPQSAFQTKRSITGSGTMVTEAGSSQFYAKYNIVPILDSSASTSDGNSCSLTNVRVRKLTPLQDCSTRFPKLEECAHFHYEFVDLGCIEVSLEESDSPSDRNSSSEQWYQILVRSGMSGREWTIRRSYESLYGLDRQLHRCIFDRKTSLLPEMTRDLVDEIGANRVLGMVAAYLTKFSKLCHNMINCGPVLSWLEMDNRGNRLIVSDNDAAINVPAIGAAHAVKRYVAKAADELSFEVGDILSIIDKPPLEESAWWRAKKNYEVGFFPAECVEMFGGDKIPQAVTTKMPENTKPVLRKRGKLISFLRTFFTSRPARSQLKRTGIVRERVFGCDLGEHLLNSEHDVPAVLKTCAEVIEVHGVVDGIYRLCGVASNIQRLRNVFDEDQEPPTLADDILVQDIHSVSSLLKMYFRELPNPLLTYQLYSKFLEAMSSPEQDRISLLRELVLQLPPPHYRTAAFLMRHLSNIASHGARTGMHCKNLAIVWAPNLLRCKDLERNQCSAEALRDVCIQSIVTEYLISYADELFDDAALNAASEFAERPARLRTLTQSSGTRLLSLEEAQERKRAQMDISQHSSKFIDVGGGPSALPPKYHTVIDIPKGKKGMRKIVSTKKSSPPGTSSWKRMFSKSHSVSLRDDSTLMYEPKTLGDTGTRNTDSENELQLSEDDVIESGRKIHSEGSLMTRSATAVDEPVNFGSVWRDTKRISMSCDIPPCLTEVTPLSNSGVSSGSRLSLSSESTFRRSVIRMRSQPNTSDITSAVLAVAVPARPPPLPPRCRSSNSQVPAEFGLLRPAPSPVNELENNVFSESVVRDFFGHSGNSSSKDIEYQRGLSENSAVSSPEQRFMSWSLNDSSYADCSSTNLVAEVSETLDAILSQGSHQHPSIVNAFPSPPVENPVEQVLLSDSFSDLSSALQSFLAGSNDLASVNAQQACPSDSLSASSQQCQKPVKSVALEMDTFEDVQSPGSDLDGRVSVAGGSRPVQGEVQSPICVAQSSPMSGHERIRPNESSALLDVSDNSDDMLSDMNSSKQLSETACRLYDTMFSMSPATRKRRSFKLHSIHSEVEASTDFLTSSDGMTDSSQLTHGGYERPLNEGQNLIGGVYQTSSPTKVFGACTISEGETVKELDPKSQCNELTGISQPSASSATSLKAQMKVSLCSPEVESTKFVSDHEGLVQDSPCTALVERSCIEPTGNVSCLDGPDVDFFMKCKSDVGDGNNGIVDAKVKKCVDFSAVPDSAKIPTGLRPLAKSRNSTPQSPSRRVRIVSNNISECTNNSDSATNAVQPVTCSGPEGRNTDGAISRKRSIKEIKSQLESRVRLDGTIEEKRAAESESVSLTSSVAERRKQFQTSVSASSSTETPGVVFRQNPERCRTPKSLVESDLPSVIPALQSSPTTTKPSESISARFSPASSNKGRFVTRSSVFGGPLAQMSGIIGETSHSALVHKDFQDFGRLTDRRKLFEATDGRPVV